MKSHVLCSVLASVTLCMATTAPASPVFTSLSQTRYVAGTADAYSYEPIPREWHYTDRIDAPDFGLFDAVVESLFYRSQQSSSITDYGFSGDLTASPDGLIDTISGSVSSSFALTFQVLEPVSYSITASISSRWVDANYCVRLTGPDSLFLFDLQGIMDDQTMHGSPNGTLEPGTYTFSASTHAYIFQHAGGTSSVSFAVRVPEPATLSLLAMGAVAVLKRRRTT